MKTIDDVFQVKESRGIDGASSTQNELHNSTFSNGPETSEIREIVVELKGYFDTYEHEMDTIKQIEVNQDTLCQYELSIEDYLSLVNFFKDLDILFE